MKAKYLLNAALTLVIVLLGTSELVLLTKYKKLTNLLQNLRTQSYFSSSSSFNKTAAFDRLDFLEGVQMNIDLLEHAPNLPNNNPDQHYILSLVFDKRACSSCIWETLRDMKAFSAQKSCQKIICIAVSDSNSIIEARSYFEALKPDFPLMILNDLNTIISDSNYWEPPLMAFIDKKRNKIIYCRFEDGIAQHRQSFLNKISRFIN